MDVFSVDLTPPCLAVLVIIFFAGVIGLCAGVAFVLVKIFDMFCCHIVSRVFDSLDDEFYAYLDRKVSEKKAGGKDGRRGKDG